MEFRILGPLEVEEPGRSVGVGGGRQWALLALLLLHANEVVSQERLIDELWGEEPPQTAAKVLHNYVSALRQELGSDAIATRAPGYVLSVDGEALDAMRFERLVEDGRGEPDPALAAERFREALALWRGEALAEFTGEEFAQAEIRRLGELRLVALEGRIDADLALGGGAELVPELEALVVEEPLRERPRGQLMLALYRSGRQPDALEAYRDARMMLVDELGLEPSPELQELERRILRQDPSLAPARGRLGAKVTPRRGARRLLLAAVVAAIALVAAGAAVLLTRGGGATTVVPNSIAKIDPKTHEIVAVYPVGGDPFKPAVAGDYVFVANRKDKTLSRIDTRSGEVDTFGDIPSPGGVAAGADGTIWVGSTEANPVRQVQADNLQLLTLLRLEQFSIPYFVAVGGGSVWVSQDQDPAVLRFNARTGKLQHRYPLQIPDFSVEITFGEGAAWSGVGDGAGGPGALLRMDALGGGSNRIEVGAFPQDPAVGFGAVWVADVGDDDVRRVGARSQRVDATIPVGSWPFSVATGAGSVWVANNHGRTISQIDPRTKRVVDTFGTRYYPKYIVYGRGYLWVSLQSHPFQPPGP